MYQKFIAELCEFFKCEIKDLKKFLFCPFNRAKLCKKYRNTLLRTTYRNRCKNHHIFRFAGLSLQDTKHCKAYNSFLGVSVLQHFYARHRILVKNFNLPCVLEITPQGDSKYYPIELLEIYDEEEGIQDDYKQRVNNKPFIDSQTNNSVSLNCVCKYFI